MTHPPDAFRRHSFEIQFWGYETGNVLASITGSGGPQIFAASLAAAWAETGGNPAGTALWLARDYPETFATLGVIALIALAHPVCRAARLLWGERAGDAVNVAVVPLATALLAYALLRDASFFTVAACAFVLGSALLRGAGSFPLLLKLGGLLLTLGGVALLSAGIDVLGSGIFGTGERAALVALATVATGFYVAGAGALTYMGGIHVCAAGHAQPRQGWLGRWLDPGASWIGGVCLRHVDPPIRWGVRNIVCPSIFWVDAATREAFPFRTSMMARLPWRVATGGLALSTGGAAGLCFAVANLLWALGDIAIGALDAPDRRRVAV